MKSGKRLLQQTSVLMWRLLQQQGGKVVQHKEQDQTMMQPRANQPIGVTGDGRADRFGLADKIVAGAPVQPSPKILHKRKPEKVFTELRMRQAWLAVRKAGGGPGADRVTLKRFEARLDEELMTLREELICEAYRPRPIRQVLVPKQNSQWRGLAIWAIRDRVAQRVLYDLLSPTFEAIFLPCSFGFRPGRSVADAVGQLLKYRDQNLRWVVDADIRNCFDEIDHRRLVRLLRRRVRDPLLLRYADRWLHAKLMSSLDGKPRAAGTCQGSVLSPLFANIYLHELDKTLRREDLALVRYADDLVICCRRKVEAVAAEERTRAVLKKLGLRLNEHKTQIVHIDDGLRWLGYSMMGGRCQRL